MKYIKASFIRAYYMYCKQAPFDVDWNILKIIYKLIVVCQSSY